MDVLRFFRRQALTESAAQRIATKIYKVLGFQPLIDIENGFYVGLSGPISEEQYQKLKELLWKTYDPEGFGDETFLQNPTVIEIGPNMNFQTPWSSRAVSICHRIGLPQVQRIERTTRYGIDQRLTEAQIEQVAKVLFNRMTEEHYKVPLVSFDPPVKAEGLQYVRLWSQGIEALRAHNEEQGYGMDEVDLQRDTSLFQTLQRDATDVEIAQLGQGDSNHCRHWDYNGIFYIDGVRSPKTLMQRIKGPYLRRPGNATGAFDDNSSAIRGYRVPVLVPSRPGRPSRYELVEIDFDILFSAETHNHPSMWEAYWGSNTGLGGIIRDLQCERNGGIYSTASVGFAVSNLCLAGDSLPWEETLWRQLSVRQPAQHLLIQAMAGGYDYGDCFGLPVDNGFLRTIGIDLPDEYDRRVQFEKPIVFINIAGVIPHVNMEKREIAVGDYVVYSGGPAYRVGVGGGSASSQDGDTISEALDFKSVQRGDPPVEQPLDRVVQACAYLGEKNPSKKKHDSGAGGSGNNIPEAVYPLGADIYFEELPVGDPTMSPREIWICESQEHNVDIIEGEENLETYLAMCRREECFAAVVGRVTGTGRLVVRNRKTGETYVDLPMEEILGDRPPKEYHFERLPITRHPVTIPEDLTVRKALDLVLRLPSAGSKEALVTRVDGSVGGYVIQGQRVGPMAIPVSDYAVTAISHFSLKGYAKSVGERPLGGFNSAQAQVRMTFAEALLNAAPVVWSSWEDVKCQSNFMTGLRHPNQGAWLDDAVTALEAFVDELLTCQPTGGKDSSGMRAKMISPSGEAVQVRSPSEFVVSAQVTVPDVTSRVTPYLNVGDQLIWVDLSPDKKPLGGSAFAQVLGQVGNDFPDIEARRLYGGIMAVQKLVSEKAITAYHDISDDGLILAVLEMAFASNTGLSIGFSGRFTPLEVLFSAAPGFVIACDGRNIEDVFSVLMSQGLDFHLIGQATSATDVKIAINDQEVLEADMLELRELWRETSYKLDELQSNPASVAEERLIMRTLAKDPPARLTFVPKSTPDSIMQRTDKPKVAVLRAICTNGDRELSTSLFMSGFEVFDYDMQDLLSGEATIKGLNMIALAGGFADGDVPETAVGWVKLIQDNPIIADQFAEFRQRTDTLIFGVCNGFQVLARLGWLPGYDDIELREQPILTQNRSGRFQSRVVAVRFEDCDSYFTTGMAGTILPQTWIAHGEGYAYFPAPKVHERVEKDRLVAMRFVDFDGQPTELHPFSNGSPGGITGLASPDRRVLGIMPHLERTYRLEQMFWRPKDWQGLSSSPYLTIFQNACNWILTNR